MKAQKRKLYRLLNILIAALLVLALLALLAARIGLNARWTTVMTVDGERVRAVEVNYAFRDCYDDFRAAYADKIEDLGLLQSGVDLDRQLYGENLTWAQFFYDNCRTTVVRSQVLSRAAAKEGVALDAEGRQTVEDRIALLEGYAGDCDKSLGQFLRSFYGPAATVKTYRAHLERLALAEQYSKAHYEDDDQWTAWYEAMEAGCTIEEKEDMVRYLYCGM